MDFLRRLFNTRSSDSISVESNETNGDNRLGKLFTTETYTQALTDRIVFYLNPMDLQRLTLVNRNCKLICDREFSKVAKRHMYTSRVHLKNILWFTVGYFQW